MKQYNLEIKKTTNFFDKALFDNLYNTVINFFAALNIPTQLPPTLAWKADTINPESFMYYEVLVANELVPKQYTIRAIVFIDGTLSYYSAEKMELEVRSFHIDEWYRISFVYDIDSHKLTVDYQLPDEEEAFFLQTINKLGL